MMLVGIVEKIGFPIATAVLYAQNRVSLTIVAFASIDLVLGVLFLISYVKTSEPAKPADPCGDLNF